MNRKHKILIADDDRALVHSLTVRLKAQGYEVLCALDAYQALEFTRKHNPDVLLLDINMPAGDGFSVRERLHKMPELAHIPVIYLTGEKSQRVVHGAAHAGAYAVIYKPFDKTELLQTIREALDTAAAEIQPA